MHLAEVDSCERAPCTAAIFNLPSSAVLSDGTFRTTDYKQMTIVCVQLCAVEIVMFFCTVFVQYRFHGEGAHKMNKKSFRKWMRRKKKRKKLGQKIPRPRLKW